MTYFLSTVFVFSLVQVQSAVDFIKSGYLLVTKLRFFIENRPYFELRKGPELCSINPFDQSEDGVRVVTAVVVVQVGEH